LGAQGDEKIMVIGDRLKTLREAKDLSQGDIEKRTGLFRCYISRVENGHTVPSLETLEKFASALELPLYHLMFEGDKPPVMPKAAKHTKEDSLESSRSGALLMKKLVSLLAKMDQEDRNLILFLAGRVARKQGGAKAGHTASSAAA
jgi:transcriptional regulator with XRE-family HTH domain